ncbi:hypothetical protein B7P43_G07189 [Cryptotermes secundus]|uniref:DUF4200 domain-containing protein n=1 Tax=Cryptotermes secundus TaxID=105785 RepID=A0A2J7PJR2_9NEOP|nr:cilia- and flagella-associated protein 100 [Cryptotermes secundus]XP_033611003.1 cilia- and flagella-associated protein 100 [Cryptotermes secundus]PNF16549.1 hypothetical protein B7P43_G07189 [Cryptotermes secundus]
MKPSSAPTKARHEAARNSGRSHKTKRPSALERYTDRSAYYFSSGTGVDTSSMRDVLKEPTPFSFAPDTDEFSCRTLHKLWRQRSRDEEARHDFSTRPNYRSRQNRDLLKRLYVPGEEVQECREPGLLDIDPQYFKILEGRPVREKLNIRKYVEEVRGTLKARLRVGYRLDEAMHIEEMLKKEQKRLRNAEAMHKLYADCFSEFLEQDYESSMELLNGAQKEAEKTADMSYQLKELEKELGALKRDVSTLEEKWRNCKMFQKFLYMVSPMDWRRKHDYIHRKGPSSVLLVSEMPSLFGRYRLSITESEAPLESLLDLFLEDIDSGEEPFLYFTEPRELTQVLQDMESQNLNCFMHSGDLSGPIRAAEQGLEQVQDQLNTQSGFVMGKIKDLEAAISWEEDRTQSLKDKAREVLYGLYKDHILSERTLKLHVFVEDVYETYVAPRDSSVGLRDMMRGIELKVESLLLKLDYLPFEIVKVAESKTYEDEARIRKEAQIAELKIKLVEKLKRRLRRALEPPDYRHGKPLKPRSEPPPIRKKRPKPEKHLTDEEKDFLDFFTDYCCNVDNARVNAPVDVSGQQNAPLFSR